MKATKAILAAAVTLVAGSTLVVANHTNFAQAAESKEDPIVLIETTKGPIKIKVFKKEAPITSNNFLDLVGKHFYDGLTFHRYDPGFVIQGGDPTGTGSGNYTDPQTKRDRLIPLEKVPGLTHDSAGTVAMARTENPNSASCQFYITLKATPFLDNPPGYAVFGKVISGMDTVNKIRVGDKMTKLKIEG